MDKEIIKYFLATTLALLVSIIALMSVNYATLNAWLFSSLVTLNVVLVCLCVVFFILLRKSS